MLSPLIKSVPTSPGPSSSPLVVEDLRLVARHDLAGAARPDLARAVGDEDVQDLGRADAVEDLHAEPLEPLLEDVLRQRLPGRDAHPHAAQARAAALLGGVQQGRIARGHAVKHRRLVAIDRLKDASPAWAGPAAARSSPPARSGKYSPLPSP